MHLCNFVSFLCNDFFWHCTQTVKWKTGETSTCYNFGSMPEASVELIRWVALVCDRAISMFHSFSLAASFPFSLVKSNLVSDGAPAHTVKWNILARPNVTITPLFGVDVTRRFLSHSTAVIGATPQWPRRSYYSTVYSLFFKRLTVLFSFSFIKMNKDERQEKREAKNYFLIRKRRCSFQDQWKSIKVWTIHLFVLIVKLKVNRLENFKVAFTPWVLLLALRDVCLSPGS